MFTEDLSTSTNMPRGSRKSTRRVVGHRNKRRNMRAVRRPPILSSTALYPSSKLRRNSSVATNAIRRFIVAPARINANSLDGKWWFENLKTVGVIIMRILAFAISAEELDRIVKRTPTIGCRFDLVAGAIPCGSITKIGFGPEDLLAESSFVSINEAGVGTGHFRQARIKWVNFILTPPTNALQHGGMIAAALLPVSREQYNEDLSTVSTEHFTMRELLSIPGVIYKSAITPTVLRYTPRANDFASSWMQFGTQSTSKVTGGDVCVYLCVCYHNMAADSQNTVSSQMTPSHALLDLTVESRVQLREYDEEVLVRTYPPIFTPSNVIGVSEFGRHRLIKLEDCDVHDEVVIFNDPILTMSE